MPERVQLSRAKGWRMPTGTRKVDRSTPWGNPFSVLEPFPAHWVPRDVLKGVNAKLRTGKHGTFASLNTSEQAVALFRWWIKQGDQIGHCEMARHVLSGKNLACWCALDQPCHADVLLEVAN